VYRIGAARWLSGLSTGQDCDSRCRRFNPPGFRDVPFAESEARPEADLREQSFCVDSIHAELRWIHFCAHLAAQKILTAEQIAEYTRLRHEQM